MRELRKAAELKLEHLPKANFKMILDTQLAQYTKSEHVFVFEEFIYGLENTPLKFDAYGMLSPVFELGLTESVVMSTGHRAESTLEFLKEHYPNVDLQIHGSLLSMAGGHQEYSPKVHCCSTGMALSKMLERAQEIAKQKPVMIYSDWPFTLANLDVPKNAYVKEIANQEDLLTAMETVLDYDYGIVKLSSRYTHGVDLRFGKDAAVLIAAKKIPNGEDCDQMISRGVRTLADKHGELYLEAPETERRSIQRTLAQKKGKDWLSASIIINILRRMQGDVEPQNINRDVVINKTKGKYLYDIQDFLNLFGAGVRKKLQIHQCFEMQSRK